MENLLAKIGTGLLATGFLFGLIKFLLRYYVSRIDNDIKEVKGKIDTAFEKIDILRDKNEKIGKEFENFKGYIQGKSEGKE